jgi:Fe-S-cluster containining protein
MKLEELESLISGMNLRNVLIKPEDVTFNIGDKGDLKSTFPVLMCDQCEEKCCPPRVTITLYDIARFMDNGLDDSIAGKFQGWVEFFLSGNKDVRLYRPYMSPGDPKAKNCVFLNEDGKCDIYINRPLGCRSFPLSVKLVEDGKREVLWGLSVECRNYEISSDETEFRSLLGSAIQDYNERLKTQALLKNRRNQLRDIGFGKYMEDEWILLAYYYRKYRDMQKQVEELQQRLEQLKKIT